MDTLTDTEPSYEDALKAKQVLIDYLSSSGSDSPIEYKHETEILKYGEWAIIYIMLKNWNL